MFTRSSAFARKTQLARLAQSHGILLISRAPRAVVRSRQMVGFALELHVSRTDTTAVGANVEPARTAAEGRLMSYRRSNFMPEDDMCVLIVEASSTAAVGEIANRAGLSARVVEAAAR
jgi:hypothetical protein